MRNYIDIIAGARPNFMKIAPMTREINERANELDFHFRLIHTGQHYDKNLSETFFEQLNIPLPDHNLNVKGKSQSEQTGGIMIKYEELLDESEYLPRLCLVVGDVNSTMACSIVAKKKGIPVVHVEAGIRSGDMKMPEEINRIVTDSIADYFFTTTEHASNNLIKLGTSSEKVFFVGNTMIDTLRHNLDRLKKPAVWDEAGLEKRKYFVLTLHRPSNVDDEEKLAFILDSIQDSCPDAKIIFPVHPRTRARLNSFKPSDKLKLIEPMGYLEFIYLVKHASGVITDSGGITEEATVLGVPCVTMRNTTERPETVKIGTNLLVGNDIKALKNAISQITSGNWKEGKVPDLWDGSTSKRIVEILNELLKK